MSNKIFTCLFICLFLFNLPGKAQSSYAANKNCLDEKFENDCYSLIKFIFRDYVYLKSRAFSSDQNQDVTFSVSLKKNISYVFNICEGSGEKGKNTMVLELYDEDNNLVISGKDNKINFKPKEAGRYYLTTSFEKNKRNCYLILCGMLNK